MTEAARSVVDHGFSKLGVHHIEASILDVNPAARRLLFRLGFRHEGTLRERHLFQGRSHDELWFGLLRTEWLGSTGTKVIDQ